MRFFSPLTAIVFVGASVVNAHFNISYPAVRGAFNDDNEVNFCGLYLPSLVLRLIYIYICVCVSMSMLCSLCFFSLL
jgi:hypothetical protein